MAVHGNKEMLLEGDLENLGNALLNIFTALKIASILVAIAVKFHIRSTSYFCFLASFKLCNPLPACESLLYILRKNVMYLLKNGE